MTIHWKRRLSRRLQALVCCSALAACGGGDSVPTPPPPPAAISGLPDVLLVRGASQLATGTSAPYATNVGQDLGDLVHSWDFGDGSTSAAAQPSHVYAAQGRYTIRVTVRNGAGTARSASTPVWVGRFADLNGIDCTGPDRSGWCLQNPDLHGTYWFADNHWGWTTMTGQILGTSDGGATWIDRFRYPYGRFGEVRFANRRVGYVLGARPLETLSLFKTTDSGHTWQQIVLPDPRITGALTVINADKLIVSNDSGLPPWASNDGGLTWTIIDPPARFVRNLNQFDSVDGFPGGLLYGLDSRLDSEGGFQVVKSTDAGRSFVPIGAQPPGVPTPSFIDELRGWSLDGSLSPGGPGLSRTLDGGASWQAVAASGLPTLQDLLADELSLRGLSFLNESAGYISFRRPAPNRFLLPSTVHYLTGNGGQTWTRALDPPGFNRDAHIATEVLSARVLSSSFVSTTGVVENHLSRDAGATWALTRERAGKALRDETTLFTTAWPWFRSTDAGVSWNALVAGRPSFPATASSLRTTQLQPGETVYLSASHWLTMNGDGNLSRTRDGGRHWAVETPSIPDRAARFAASPSVKLQFVTPSVGWFLREGRSVFKTSDAGATWAEQPVSPVPDTEPPRPADVFFLDALNGWVASAPYPGLRPAAMSEASYAQVGTVVRRTTDGGNSWASAGYLPFPATSIRFASASTGLAVGPTGAIATTNDGGTTWTLRPSPTAKDLTRVHWIDGTAALAFAFTNNGDVNGMGAALLQTTDGGATWREVALPRLPPDAALSDAAFSSPRQGWIVGGYGTVLVTSDGGATWAQQSSPNYFEHLVAVRAEGQQVTAMGSSGLVLVTVTGGQ